MSDQGPRLDELYKGLFEQIPDGVFITQPDGAILRANPAACRMLRREEAEVVRAGRAAIVVDSPRLRAALVERERSGEVSTELELVRGDGTTFPAELTSALIPGEDGELFACTIFRDITGRRQAEAALRDRDYLLSESQRIAHIGTWRLDLSSGQMQWSEETYRVHGVDPDAFRPAFDTFFQLIHPDDRPAMTDWVRACTAGEAPGELDFRIVLADGSLRVLQGRGELLPAAGDRPASIAGTVQDVTARRQAQAEVARLATAIDQVAETVFITDTSGVIVYVNRAFEAVSGYTRAEALGQNPRLLKSGLHDAAFYRTLWDTIRSGRTWHGRLMNRRKNGQVYTEDATISPVRDAAGRITTFVAVKRDITRELEVEAQLLQAQKMESVGRLAGGVAHDFNNILSVILGYAGFALQRLREGDPLREDLLEVEKAGQRAAALTAQLLAFSRKQILQPVPLDLNRVLGEVEKMLGRVIGEDLDLALRLAPGLGIVKADPGQIQQVIVNLVVNARDAMPRGGRITIETANVELDADYAARHPGMTSGSFVMLAVSDSGVGMDAATLSRVFEPFFTTKEAGRGTGLGLSTVYGIVTQSGGSVHAYSEPGRGSTFKAYLPRLRTREVPGGLTASAVATLAGTETVLVVEDDSAVRALAALMLRSAGYRPLVAASGAEALRACEQHPDPIHLVITDMVIPGMSGTDFRAHLERVRPGVKMLFMSGYTEAAALHQGTLPRGVPFISKPLTRAALLQKVREVLDSRSPA